MSERLDPDSGETPPAERRRGCQFPLSHDDETGEFEYCGFQRESTGKGGRPGEYCQRTVLGDDGRELTHNRTTAFQRRRELERGIGPARREKAEDRPVSAAKPSSAATSSPA